MRRLHGWRLALAVGSLATVTALVTLANSELSAYAAFADGTGSPTVAAFGPGFAPQNWTIQFSQNYPWATQYFGDNSSFDRYTVQGPHTPFIWADVERTDNQATLDAYNLQNCFLFHNDQVATSQRIDLGHGVTGLLLNYYDPSTKSRWASVSWAWPIVYNGQTNYQRIELTSSPFAVADEHATAQVTDGLRGFFLDLVNGLTGNVGDNKSLGLYKNADASLQTAASTLVLRGISGAK